MGTSHLVAEHLFERVGRLGRLRRIDGRLEDVGRKGSARPPFRCPRTDGRGMFERIDDSGRFASGHVTHAVVPGDRFARADVEIGRLRQQRASAQCPESDFVLLVQRLNFLEESPEVAPTPPIARQQLAQLS